MIPRFRAVLLVSALVQCALGARKLRIRRTDANVLAGSLDPKRHCLLLQTETSSKMVENNSMVLVKHTRMSPSQMSAQGHEGLGGDI